MGMTQNAQNKLDTENDNIWVRDKVGVKEEDVLGWITRRILIK